MKKLLLLPALLAPAPAFAHHAMGGETPGTLAEGLLSGLAHPVIGFDHLAFVVLVGLAAALAGRLALGAAAFVGATVLGTLLHLGGAVLPAVELLVAASVVLLGAVLVAGRHIRAAPALAGFGLAGLFHGQAYGDAVIGAEPTPILAYLVGFAAIQFAVAAGVGGLARTGAEAAAGRAPLRAQLAGAVCFGVGLTFLLENVEGMVFAVS